VQIHKKITVSEGDAGKRLDQVLALRLEEEVSRSQIKKWIQESKILVNQKRVKPHHPLKEDDVIDIEAELGQISPLKPSEIPLTILFEDEDLLVVNKPVGMVVHPGAGAREDTLVNALVFHTSSKLSDGSHPLRPGIVHRLDKDTSGLLVVAKNDWIHERLAKQFKAHTIERTYWVLVRGIVEHDEIHCEEPLAKSPLHRKQMIVDPARGKYSASFFTVKERFRNATLLEARLQTGRTHQIRVHLKHLGHPVLGDLAYGVPSSHIHRQALHAKTLSFTHPRTEKRVSFDSDLPDDFSLLLNYMRKSTKDS